MSYPQYMRREMLNAGKSLAKREVVMRTAILSHQAVPVCVAACVDFFCEAVRRLASDGFDELADLLDEEGIEHCLSSRTFDLVFESGVVSDAVVLRLVRLFDEDADFRDAMIDQGWATSVDLWRSKSVVPEPAVHASRADSFGWASPPIPSIPPLPLSPQGDLFATIP